MSAAVREDRFGNRVPPVGTVLRWRHQGSTHVAIHVGDDGSRGSTAWRSTARTEALSWEHVSALIGNSPCAIAFNWSEVPVMGPVDFGDLAVERYIARLGGSDG